MVGEREEKERGVREKDIERRKRKGEQIQSRNRVEMVERPHKDSTKTAQRQHKDRTKTAHRPHKDRTKTAQRPHTDSTKTAARASQGSRTSLDAKEQKRESCTAGPFFVPLCLRPPAAAQRCKSAYKNIRVLLR